MTIRWQDWINVLLGFWLVVSPWGLDYSLNNAATANAHGLGATIIIFNIISACRLIDEGQEIFNILLGTWLILSPYSLGFATEKAAAINVILVGAAIMSLGIWQMYDATRDRTK